jgi:MoxR-like ATPase
MNIIERTLTEALSNRFPDQTEFFPKTVTAIAEELGISSGEAYKYTTSFPKVRRGVYNLESVIVPFRDVKQEQKTVPSSVQSVVNDEVYVPSKDSTFVQWGNFKDIKAIIQSGVFYPTYITGLSGNGKTFMVEQACAQLNREYVRVQVTPETDEDDLIGGFRLINGETVFAKGPVVKAMEAGAILLIDEIDRGSNKLMCLQGVLEGKPIVIKKTGEVVKPKNGFNIIATANTKGKGSEDGRFVAATIIDESFLERFTITVEQPYPTLSTERKILVKHMTKYNCMDEAFAENLIAWSETIRKTYEDDGVDETISTRRLCHIVQSFAIFGDKMKAIELCVSRFDNDTKEAFLDLYTKVDESAGTLKASTETFDEILEGALNDWDEPF